MAVTLSLLVKDYNPEFSFASFPPTLLQSSQRDWLVHLVALVLEWLQCYNEVLMEVQDEETPLVGPFSPMEATNHETECKFSSCGREDTTER